MKKLLFSAFLWAFILQSMAQKSTFMVVVQMNATPQWLSLSREKRAEFFGKTVIPIFQKFDKTLKIRLFDSEYFHAKTSDFILIETQNLEDYQELIERLRDTKIYSEPYFEIRDYLIGQENAFQIFNEKLKKEK